MRQDELRELVWERASEFLFNVSREDYLRDLEEWTLELIECQGRPAFIWAQRGPEFHLLKLFEDHCTVPLRRYRERLRAVIEEHGSVFTRTPRHEKKTRFFNELMGFHVVGEDHLDVHYRMTTCP